MNGEVDDLRRPAKMTQPVHLTVGGLTRNALLAALAERGVLLNDHAATLIEHPAFDERAPEPVLIVDRSVAELGLADGGTLAEVLAAGQRQGLRPCSPDTGPYLRLAWGAQANSSDSVTSSGRAPTGAITVASEPLDEDHDYPKGFYLRVVDGQLWLRGYRCDDLHVFSPNDRFAFVAP